MESKKAQKTIVVGAGPVGCLAAIYAAQRGDQVEIYELRGDLRDPSVTPLNFTRSINLALSERGINALRHANRPKLLESILNETIPMHGRMIHGEKDGEFTQDAQPYDVNGRFIRAADRGELNKALLDDLESMPNVTFFFNHRIVGADFKRNLAWFEKREAGNRSRKSVTEIEVSFDFMIGADGAHSSVRYHLMKFSRMSYEQEYINTLWCEFHIPPSATSPPDFRLPENYLHIWPGGSFMFIAIPSADKSFTATLFLVDEAFKTLDADPESLIAPFFKKNFPGVVPDLISEEEVVKQYKINSHLPLISIKCSPYHYSSSVVIVGDAAHAMVPFYGQGMNAGLEDVRILFSHLDSHSTFSPSINAESTAAMSRSAALDAYTAERHPDALAICDLALANYAEMSSHVLSPVYRLRKFIEEALTHYTPRLGWATQYARISFGNERYSVVKEETRRQKKVLRNATAMVLGGGTGLLAMLALGIWRRSRS